MFKTPFFLLLIFFIVSFFTETLFGQKEVLPFYEWEMFSSKPRFITFKVLIIDKDQYSSLHSRQDGLMANQKNTIEKLCALSTQKKLSFIKNIKENAHKATVYSFEVNALRYYLHQTVEKKNKLCSISLY